MSARACNSPEWTVKSDPSSLDHGEDAMATTAVSTGYRKGFETLDRELALDRLPVTGALPPWLAGSLVRTGPAKFEAGDRSMRHWFDGLAMLHRFSFADGAASYACRFMDTPAYRAATEGGRI